MRIESTLVDDGERVPALHLVLAREPVMLSQVVEPEPSLLVP